MPDIQSFRPPFSKGGAVKGAGPLSPIAMGETPPILPKTQERVNFFACKERGRTLVGGSPFLVCVCCGGGKLFKEKVFPPPNPHLSKTLNVGCFFVLHTC